MGQVARFTRTGWDQAFFPYFRLLRRLPRTDAISADLAPTGALDGLSGEPSQRPGQPVLKNR